MKKIIHNLCVYFEGNLAFNNEIVKVISISIVENKIGKKDPVLLVRAEKANGCFVKATLDKFEIIID